MAAILQTFSFAIDLFSGAREWLHLLCSQSRPPWRVESNTTGMVRTFNWSRLFLLHFEELHSCVLVLGIWLIFCLWQVNFCHQKYHRELYWKSGDHSCPATAEPAEFCMTKVANRRSWFGVVYDNGFMFVLVVLHHIMPVHRWKQLTPPLQWRSLRLSCGNSCTFLPSAQIWKQRISHSRTRVLTCLRAQIECKEAATFK
jgi:hypothetical protein